MYVASEANLTFSKSASASAAASASCLLYTLSYAQVQGKKTIGITHTVPSMQTKMFGKNAR